MTAVSNPNNSPPKAAIRALRVREEFMWLRGATPDTTVWHGTVGRFSANPESPRAGRPVRLPTPVIVNSVSARLFAIVLLPTAVFAQSSIQGVVIDPSGAAVPDATITVAQEGTGVVRSVRSTAEGRYRIPYVA